jgi:hypothetical protein
VPSSGEGGVNRTKLDGGWKIKKDIVVMNKLTNSSAADGLFRSFLLWRCGMGRCCDGGGIGGVPSPGVGGMNYSRP